MSHYCHSPSTCRSGISNMVTDALRCVHSLQSHVPGRWRAVGGSELLPGIQNMRPGWSLLSRMSPTVPSHSEHAKPSRVTFLLVVMMLCLIFTFLALCVPCLITILWCLQIMPLTLIIMQMVLTTRGSSILWYSNGFNFYCHNLIK